MICVFPDPYPDELLYSVCTRYGDLMQYPSGNLVADDFFGKKYVTPAVELPNCIDYLVASILPGHLYTADEFINNHTFFPFYEPFLSHARAQSVRSNMQSSDNNVSARLIGTMHFRLKRPNHLRFCPECVVSDRQQFGETYWHRIHQVTGVEVCPHHAIYLERSSASWVNSYSGNIASAEQVVCDTPAKQLNLSSPIHRIQLKVARFATWLLEGHADPIGGQTIQKRYFNLLLAKGFAHYNGRIRAEVLIRSFIKYHTSQWLARLGCSLKETVRGNWLMRLLNTNKAETFQHPLYHILLLIFLDCAIKDFFTEFKEYKPFGDGPWPCLNHAADHYRQPKITSCRITNNFKKYVGKPLGTFRCHCGFTYTRTGPDQTEEDRFKVSTVRAYGSIWEETLRKLWADTSVSHREIEAKLGVTNMTIRRHAIKLGLTYPRTTARSRARLEAMARYKLTSLQPQDVLGERRKELLELIKANPGAMRSELRELDDSLLRWLGKHDPEWLEDQLPPAQRINPKPVIIDWDIEDIRFAEIVKETALEIRSNTNPPLRVSTTAIIKRVGRERWIKECLNKLPLTAKVLGEFVESFEDFFIRKINLTAAYFLKERVIPARTVFMDHAGIGYHCKAARTDRVQRAFDAALLRLAT